MSANPGEHTLSAAEVDERLERLRVLEAVHDAADRLADAGPVSEIVDRAPAEACRALALHRCLLSRIDDGGGQRVLVGRGAHRLRARGGNEPRPPPPAPPLPGSRAERASSFAFAVISSR